MINEAHDVEISVANTCTLRCVVGGCGKRLHGCFVYTLSLACLVRREIYHGIRNDGIDITYGMDKRLSMHGAAIDVV